MSDLEKLTAERDALAAQVEALRDALQAVMASIGGGKKFCGHEFDCICAGDKARAALAATPQQHLAEIRAEAGRAGFVAGFKRRTALGPLRKMWSEEEIIELYNQYADSIRRGEVE